MTDPTEDFPSISTRATHKAFRDQYARARASLDAEALRLGEFGPAVLEVARQHGQADEEGVRTLAISLCVLGVQQRLGPDALADLVREMWPSAAMAVLEKESGDEP